MRNVRENPQENPHHNINTVSYADGQLCRNDYEPQVTNPIQLIEAASPAQTQALHQIQHKAAVYDQLSAALKGGTDLLSKQFECPDGEELAEQAYTLFLSALEQGSPATLAIRAEAEKQNSLSQGQDYQPGGSFSTAEAIQEFADYIKLKELSEYTIENNYIPFLKRIFTGYGVVPTDPKLIRRLLAHYTNRNTRRTYWLYFSTFYSFLEQEHDIPNPMSKVPKPKESKTLPDHLNPEQKELLLKAELSPRDRSLIDLLIVSGLRPSDIADINGRPLRFCDIYADHIEVTGKGDKGRSVPIPPELRVELLALQNGRRADLAVFVNEWGRPLTTWGLRKLVRRAFIAAGITGVKLTPYTIRHSFGGDFLARGGNLASLQRILGHASVKTTMRYTHLSDKAVADDYQRHMPRANNCLL